MNTPNRRTMIAIVGTGALFLLLGTVSPLYSQREQHDQDAKPGQQEQQQEQQAVPARQEQQQDRPQKQEQQAEPAKQEPQQVRPEKQKQRAEPQKQEPQQVRPEKQRQQAEPAKKEPQQDRPQKREQQAEPAKQEQQQPRPQRREQQAMPAKQEQQQPSLQKREQQTQPARQEQTKQSSQQVQHVQQTDQRGVWQQHRAHSWQTEHHTWRERGGYNGYRIPDDNFHGYFGQDHRFRVYNLSLEIFSGHPRFKYNGYWFSILDPWPEYWSEDWYETDDVYIDYSNDGYYLYNRKHPGVGIAISIFTN